MYSVKNMKKLKLESCAYISYTQYYLYSCFRHLDDNDSHD